jgi:hypothetical protein
MFSKILKWLFNYQENNIESNLKKYESNRQKCYYSTDRRGNKN